MMKKLTMAAIACGILAAAAASSMVLAADNTAEIALVMTAEGTVDDRGFFEGTYNGIKKFCEETGHTYGYYNPTENSMDAVYEVMDLAVQNGAQVICVAGTDFREFAVEVFSSYPEVTFICNELHGVTDFPENTVDYIYKAQEATFLAGVAAVYEGYKNLGVMCGMQIPPNLNGGYGFMQGINWAAGELGVEGIDLKYWYTNSFVPSADIQSYAASWYESGTELIGAFCGGAAPSIYAAAEAADGKAMGCDVDQSGLSETIVTSFLKNCNVMTYGGLVAWENGTLEGGSITNVGLKEGAVGLEMENARFTTFTQEILDDVTERYLNGEFEIIDYTVGESPNDMYDYFEEKNMTFTYYE